MPTYEIVKHTRDYEKESRTGRVYTGMVTTWDVVCVETCSLMSEHYRKRDAKAALEHLMPATRLNKWRARGTASLRERGSGS